jgi:hypothetical protein
LALRGEASITRLSKILPNWDFWFENMPFGWYTLLSKPSNTSEKSNVEKNEKKNKIENLADVFFLRAVEYVPNCCVLHTVKSDQIGSNLIIS